MLLKVKGYDLKVEYIPGKKQLLADTLSRAGIEETPKQEEEEEFQVNTIDKMSVSKPKYTEFQQKTANELNELYSVILTGWPDSKEEVPHNVRPFWNVRDKLVVLDGIVYRGMRIVVPQTMRASMLDVIHNTHLGVVKSKQRAGETLYWPGMSAQIEDKIANCSICQAYATAQPKEPMIATKPPDLPWMQVASDIFYFEGHNYILTVDYYSKYIEVTKLTDVTTSQTIEALKAHFAAHGIPEKLITDNGTQYSSSQFTQFAKEYGFEHVTSSPRYPSSNGEAEAAVNTVKRMWTKCKDKQLALLNYRATPLPGIELSPSQLLMSRRLRTTLPTARNL
ncbi:uncharacterized protein K02A2.6-like [Actinia tenebrosa]|uniref:Uncharacterized protein K02A2.6-like n=1 Tax=Actinia tenebrosa TaxID=6105 RepID=A0A6P8IWC0_ACTTE|nr:uncharacterized protein K02A2.6-like [Actinia tenebrosa]